MSTPEGVVKSRVKELLKQYSAWFFMPAMGQFGRRGIPDIVGIHKGRGFGIECKAGKGKTTPLQEIELGKILSAEGFPLVVNETEGLDVLEAWLKNG